MTKNITMKRPMIAIAVAALFAMPAVSAAQAVKTPSSVNESAPAQAGTATVPTGPGGRQPLAGGQPAYPPKGPSGVNESMPATAGHASTPTAGKGQVAAPVGRTEPMNRQMQTPSSVNESAPARTGKATVPTARHTRDWGVADSNRDGVVDRFEFDRWMDRQHSTRR